MRSQAPSLFRVIQTDYTALLAFSFPIVLWVAWAVMLFLQKVEPTFAYLAAVVTALGCVILIWRYHTLTSIFEDGLETQGIVTNVSFFRDRGRLEYLYEFQGKKYVSGNAVVKTRRTQSYPQGTKVILVVDRNNLKRAFIRDLYL